ncbi:MAG: PKD domain-containing protein, partial [candidate division Zixibacteria bacterium]|nr:PKD domain-containing protein [candidate division Zixibacteria bacterium]
THNVTFYADDGALIDSEQVVITVNEIGNQPPQLDPIGPQVTTENINLNFTVTASDPDATIPNLTTSALPSGASFVDNGDGSGTFDWTPDFTQASVYNITFFADDGSFIHSEVVAITVNEAGNQSPLLTAIGAQSTTEDVNLSFGVTATDPDATIPTLTTSTLPTGASFVDNGDGSGSFDWTPGFLDAGVYNVTFYADDGALIDSEQVAITVNEAGNQSPLLAAIGAQSTTETVNLNFGINASDPDATIPSLTTSTLPTGATFVDNGDGSGTFDWTPGFTDAGTYNVTFYADDGALIDSEQVVITVNEVGNQSPVLAAIGAQSTTEAVNLNFGISASDPDATIPSLTTSTLPTGATFVDNGDGSGTFDWTPHFANAGIYNVTFYADDGALIDSEQVVITVNEAGNQPPTLDPIGPQVTTENVNLNFIVTATDPDSTIPALSTSALPAGASFVDNGDGSGTFDWTPGFTQAGPHNVTFFADDGSFIHSEVVTITVNEAGNQSPLLAAIGAQSTFEDVNLNFGVTATDPDATIPALSTSTLPTGAGFVDNGDGSGTFDWTPGFTDAGTYNITFYADDGALIDSEQVVITVIESGNQSPVLAAIGAQSTTETVDLNFAVTATDPDATIPALSSSTVPTGATFVDNGDGSGTFDWTPGFTDAGTYNVTFYADDGALIDSEQVVITVNEVGNQSPLLAAIGAQSTTEDVNLNFGVNASDPDATIPGLTTSTLPTGATFVDNGDGSGTFDWTPGFTDAGTYNVTFYADDGALIDSEQVVITVNEAGNQAPLLATIGAQSTTEDINLNFVINASDPDATIPSLTTSTLPTGATFVDNGDGSGSFDWTPGFTDAAVYNVTFYADDGALIDSEQVVITVNEAGNQSPVLAAIGAQSTTEDINLNFGITASDPDATIPSLTTSTLPTGASFVDNGDGSGTFDWTPIFTDAGTYNVTFYADDGALIDSEQVVITVNEAGNQSPVLATIGPRSTTENVLLNFGVSASDVDATIPALSTSTLPTGATFVDNGDGSGAFDWIPTFTDAGTYNVTFYADDGALIDSEQVVITINEAGNQPPTLDPIGPQATTENVNLNFTVTASDPDATIPNLTTSALPSGATFVDNGDGSGTFDWTPDFTQAGPYNVTFFADDGSFIHSEVVAITVNEAGNQSPVLAAIGPHFTTEGIPLNIPVGATDPDGTIPALSASTLPIGASFVDNGDGTGDFDWTPGFTDASIYNVTFYADDGGLTDSEQVVITVNEAGNQSPILAAIGAQSTTETVNLNFGINASDPDATIPSLTTSTLPTGATFVDNGDGSGTFDWTPGFTDAGTYNVTFYADDGALIDSEQVVITVNDVGNQSPVLAAIGPQATDENVNLSFGVSATDPDATIPALSTSTLPFGAGFIDNGDGSGSFDWTPDFDQAGVYVITFYATDGVLIDSEQVQIVVTDINRGPTADAGSDQFNVPVGSLVTLDGTFSSDPDGDLLNYNWLQIGGTAVVLSNNADSMPTFTPPVTDTYLFELTVNDGLLPSTPDTVSIDVVNVAPPVAVSDLAIQINADAVDLTWSLSVLDTAGFATSVDRYVISRGTAAYFTPLPGDSIGFTDNLTSAFTDADLAGANVVGDTLTQYFYVVEVVDIYGNRSTLSNRVGEYDYQLVTTATTNYNLVGIPFSNTGIVDADALIAAIGSGNVLTVNNFIAASQSYEARFAAGFGTNFAITIGGVYQVNSATDTIFSVAGSIPDSGTVSYSIQTSPTTDFNFLMIPFELEGNFTVAQDLLDSIPGVLNTLNNFVAGSQSYQSRFAAGFGTNFPVKAGKPYQGNAATDGVFPGP